MKKNRIVFTSLLLVLMCCSASLSVFASTGSGTIIYGKVTEISDSKLTIAVGTLNEQNKNESNTTNPTNTNDSSTTPPTPPSDDAATSQPTPPSDSSNTQTPETGDNQGAEGEILTLTGETKTITVTDSVSITKESQMQPGNEGKLADGTQPSNGTQPTNETQPANGTTDPGTAPNSGTEAGSLTDIAINTVLKITYKLNSDEIESIEILNSNKQSGGTTQVETGTGAYNLTDGETLTDDTYTSTNADENAVRAENDITATLNDVTVKKTGGASSNSDASSFYGLNSAILALGNSVLNISDSVITATTEGSNGVFAYDGATINIEDSTINVTGGNAGGIEVAGGGIMNASNLTVNSTVKAAIRSDRGGGTMVVDGGTYTTSGSTGAPAVYSTADITVNDATLTAETSEAIVVEGLNSVVLNDCTVSGNMSGTYGSSSENIHNVMLYQSMSGDAEEGNSSFTMDGGSLTSNNGDMFYVTNTEANIELSDVTLDPATDTYLLLVSGNDGTNGWGTVGSNGGDCTFTASNQTLKGDIEVDSISQLDLTISDDSTFKGSINSDGTTASSLKVSLDSTSTWTLTADSYITEFDGSMSDVNLNGHTLYVNGVKAK